MENNYIIEKQSPSQSSNQQIRQKNNLSGPKSSKIIEEIKIDKNKDDKVQKDNKNTLQMISIQKKKAIHQNNFSEQLNPQYDDQQLSSFEESKISNISYKHNHINKSSNRINKK